VKLHILGVCGTFMGGVAQLAKAQGHEVSGSDEHVYPPMSTQLQRAGIRIHQGYRPEHLQPSPDCVVVGNVMRRGNPAVEYVLDAGLPYTSGPQWLGEQVLAGRHVLAVAGTHGKTTTSAMLAWILEDVGLDPGFLVGGVPQDLGVSARLGSGPFFVVEADEYDTAFFDKRSKFVHYRPRTLILNNLEFDHADIFDSLTDIQRQFHHLVRTVPGSGRILVNGEDRALQEVLEQGCWTPVERFGTVEGVDWRMELLHPDGSAFRVHHAGGIETIRWGLLGRHNALNATAALAAAVHAGVEPERAAGALCRFQGVKRRLEAFAEVDGITLYDDFAHHPTAIATTLAGLRARTAGRIVAVLEPRSNTMRMGVHKDRLAEALGDADRVYLYAPPDLGWDTAPVAAATGARVMDSVTALVERLAEDLAPGDEVVIMSNGSFGGLHGRLARALQARAPRGDSRVEGA